MNYQDDLGESAAEADQRVRQVLMQRENEDQGNMTVHNGLTCEGADILTNHAMDEIKSLRDDCCNGIPGCDCCRHGILPTPGEIQLFNEREALKVQLEEAQRNGNKFRDECERLQVRIGTLTRERDDAEKCDEIMTNGVTALTEALESMLGIFDNPIARRRISGEMAEEARAMARKALEKE